MRTTPFNDAFLFLIGDTPDHNALGAAKWLLVGAYWLLLLGSVVVAGLNLSRDPAQRSARPAAIWLSRLLIGTMWFQGSLWKLPLPASGGFTYWTGQLAEHSAYPWHAALVRDVLLPNIHLLDPAVWLTETFMAASLMLGVAVRLAGVVGALFMLNLWIGLYGAGAEWPWNYLFCALVHVFFFLDRAGMSLGLDALLARRAAAGHRGGRFARVVRVAG